MAYIPNTKLKRIAAIMSRKYPNEINGFLLHETVIQIDTICFPDLQKKMF